MKKVLAMLSALTADGREQTPARGRGAQEAAQAARCRRDAREAHFASDFGALLFNGNNSGRKFKHSTKLKDGSEDDWFAAWDVKNNVFVASARTAANVVYNTSGEISARRTTSRSASRLRNRDARQPAADGTRSTTLPSQVLRCQHAFAAGEKPRCLSHGTARAASVLLKVVAALLDNLKVVLSPSYVPSRKFKEAAAHAPPTPALCGSELPRHWKEGCVVFDRLCRLERVTRHHLRDGRHAHGQRRGVQAAAQDSRCHCQEARHEFLVLI